MKKTIEISTNVFAAIWARHQEGESTEDEILARVLGCQTPSPAQKNGKGYYDARNGLHLDEGFEAFRNYKGQRFVAKVADGKWVRADSGKSYPSLSALNQSIVAGNENVWNGNWKFKDATGEHPLNELRK